MFGLCEGCLEGGYEECPLYLCQSNEGFIVICCIVYAIDNRLGILGLIDLEGDEYYE